MAEFIIGNSLRTLARKNRWLQRILWRLDFALVWCLVSLFRCLPVDLASRLGASVGRWVGPRMKRKHALYRENFAIAFPELNEVELDQLATDAWGQAGRVLAEYPHLTTLLEDEQRLQIDIAEPVVTYSDPSTPCVIVTAHQSNWEVIGTAMARMGIPNATLYSPPTNPYLDKLLADSRRALMCELLARDNSARLLMRALKQGRTAAMVMDRRVDEGDTVSFFGHQKMATTMPARLALKFKCDLVPVQVIRKKDASYRVIFHPPVKPRNPTADDGSQALDLTQQVHDQFESWIKASPQDWFCSKRIWAKGVTQPPEDAGVSTDVDSYAA